MNTDRFGGKGRPGVSFGSPLAAPTTRDAGVIQGLFYGGPSAILARLRAAPAPNLPAFPKAAGGRIGAQGPGFADPKPLQPKFEPVQRKGPSNVDAFQVTLRPRSGGQPLPAEIQAKMESVFGEDFSGVRVHVGHEATSVGAIAFTWGSDIHFAPGQYSPKTFNGQKLLAHELTHVIQQRAGRVSNPFGAGLAVVQDHVLEAEAERWAMKAAMAPAPPETAAKKGA